MTTILDCPHLETLLARIAPYAGDELLQPLPAPAAGSSLEADQAPLEGHWATTVLNSAFSAGIGQLDTLRRTIFDLGFIGSHAPYSLLRTALEAFAQVTWLLSGPTRGERQARVLQTWAYDYEEHHGYDTAVGHIPVPPAKSGADLRREVIALAKRLGLSPDRVGGKPYISKVIREAAEATGHPGGEAVAAWRMASGFAHGRLWPSLRASVADGSVPIEDGTWVRIVVDDRKIDDVAMWCDRLLGHGLTLFHAQAGHPQPEAVPAGPG